MSSPQKSWLGARAIWGSVSLGLLTFTLVFLSFQAAYHDYFPLDVTVTRWIQQLGLPGLEPCLSVFSHLAAFEVGGIVLLVLVVLILWMKARPLEALAVCAISALWAGDNIIVSLVARPRPTPDIVQTWGLGSGYSFPSGHASGAITFYGLLAFLIFVNVKDRLIRSLAIGFSFSLVVLAGLSRIYFGTHWPSDVLGGYILGAIVLVAIGWLYLAVRGGWLPSIQPKCQRMTHGNSELDVVNSIASTVYLDKDRGVAIKEYNPCLLVQGLYWLAFQAPFPYQKRKEALLAAQYRRDIANLLTKHNFGYDMVSPILNIRETNGTYQLVTRFVPGDKPWSNHQIYGELRKLTDFFNTVGLPTWQVLPGNPQAYSNFIVTPEQQLKLIDLESALVLPVPPLAQLGGSLRDGHIPTFDDVDFVRLRSYVVDNEASLQQTLGWGKLDQLTQAIELCEEYTHAWKSQELVFWGHIVRYIYPVSHISILGPQKLYQWLQSELSQAEGRAICFLHSSTERWVQEGIMNDEQVNALQIGASNFQKGGVLYHLGSHLVLSAVLRFPLGSAARFLWVLAFRVRSHWQFALGQITRGEYDANRDIHSTRVMLFALVPGLGAVSYTVSKPLLRTGIARIAVDEFAYRLPFNLYRRLRLSKMTMLRWQPCFRVWGNKVISSFPIH